MSPTFLLVLFFIATDLLSGALSSFITPRPEFYTLEAYRILHRHNYFRQCHYAPPLELDRELCENTQKIANSMAENKSFSVLPGMNTYMQKLNTTLDKLVGSAFPLVPTFKAVESWYREIQFVTKNSVISNNLTQLVWKSSQKLGIGISQDNYGIVYIVCQYQPAGNIEEHFEDNVLNVNPVNRTVQKRCSLEKMAAAATTEETEKPMTLMPATLMPMLSLHVMTTDDTTMETETPMSDILIPILPALHLMTTEDETMMEIATSMPVTLMPALHSMTIENNDTATMEP